jgi:hypothetical protein
MKYIQYFLRCNAKSEFQWHTLNENVSQKFHLSVLFLGLNSEITLGIPLVKL